MLSVGLDTTLTRLFSPANSVALALNAPGDGTVVVAIREGGLRAASAVRGDGTISFGIASSNALRFQIPGTGNINAEV